MFFWAGCTWSWSWARRSRSQARPGFVPAPASPWERKVFKKRLLKLDKGMTLHIYEEWELLTWWCRDWSQTWEGTLQWQSDHGLRHSRRTWGPCRSGKGIFFVMKISSALAKHFRRCSCSQLMGFAVSMASKINDMFANGCLLSWYGPEPFDKCSWLLIIMLGQVLGFASWVAK